MLVAAVRRQAVRSTWVRRVPLKKRRNSSQHLNDLHIRLSFQLLSDASHEGGSQSVSQCQLDSELNLTSRATAGTSDPHTAWAWLERGTPKLFDSAVRIIMQVGE